MPMNPRLLRPIANNAGVTLYYNNAAGTNNWSSLGSWWRDSSHTVPANSLPGVNDTAVMSGNAFAGYAASPTIANLVVNSGAVYFDDVSEQSGLLVTGTATVNGGGYFGGGGFGFVNTLIFNAGADATESTLVFNLLILNSWSLEGVVDATGNMEAYGTTVWGNSTSNNLTGNATFNGSSRLGISGYVSGTATFNDSSCNDGGTAGTFVPNPPPSCP